MIVNTEGDPIADLRESLTRSGSRSYEVVCDMDEVLVNITPSWVAKALEDRRIAAFIGEEAVRFLTEKNLAAMVLSRSEYYLPKWLKLDEEHSKLMQAVYFDRCHEFYDTLAPTSFCNALMGTLNDVVISRVYIVTHVGPGENSSKIRFIERHMKHPKVEYVPVPLDQSKSDVINKRKINYASFVDDKLENLADMINNTASAGRDFTAPRLGYNAFSEEFMDNARRRLVRLGYYERVV